MLAITRAERVVNTARQISAANRQRHRLVRRDVNLAVRAQALSASREIAAERARARPPAGGVELKWVHAPSVSATTCLGSPEQCQQTQAMGMHCCAASNFYQRWPEKIWRNANGSVARAKLRSFVPKTMRSPAFSTPGHHQPEQSRNNSRRDMKLTVPSDRAVAPALNGIVDLRDWTNGWRLTIAKNREIPKTFFLRFTSHLVIFLVSRQARR